MRGRSLRSPETDELFFSIVENSANIAEACRVTGYARRSVYDWKAHDPEFAQRLRECEEIASEKLEQALFSRATDGVKRSEPLIYRGRIVGYKEVTEYSDTAAIFLLKARKPDMYRERVDINVNWRAELKAVGANPDDVLQAAVQAVRQKLLMESSADDIIEGEIISDAMANGYTEVRDTDQTA